jgi:hypothetical protein
MRGSLHNVPTLVEPPPTLCVIRTSGETSLRLTACLALMCAQALGYFMRFRTVDAKITPENRLLLGTFGGRVAGCFGGIGQHRKDSGVSNRDTKFKANQLNAQGVPKGSPPPGTVGRNSK